MNAEKIQKQHEARRELLTTVAERLLQVDDPQTIVEDLCLLVMHNLDCQFFFNYLVEEPGKRMVLNSCAGISREAADTMRLHDFEASVCGCVAREGRCIAVEDIQNSNNPQMDLIRDFGMHAAATQ